MKMKMKFAEIIFPVMAILFTTFNRLLRLGMHETSNQFFGQTIHRAIPVYNGIPLFGLLKKRNSDPLLFPSI